MVFDRVDVDEMSCSNKRTTVTFDCETSERQKNNFVKMFWLEVVI